MREAGEGGNEDMGYERIQRSRRGTGRRRNREGEGSLHYWDFDPDMNQSSEH